MEVKEPAFTFKSEKRQRYEIPPWINGTTTPKIFAAFIAANRAIDAVAKSRKNTQQGYSFRGIDDVYNVVHTAIADAGIITVPVTLQRRVSHAGKTKAGGDMVLTELEMEFWCYAEDGSALVIGPLWGEGLDTSDKGTNKCMSFAQKYALIQTFTIPTDDVSEGDRETPTRGGESAPRPQQQQAKQPEPKGDPIDEATAKRVYEWFLGAGVSKAAIDAKLGKPVSGGTTTDLQTLARWQDEIKKDRKSIARLFGSGQAAGSNGNGNKEQGDRAPNTGG